MTKRKILLAALSLCLVAILAVGGSLAYLTDDEQKHNTMVIGNVQINIDEYAYVNGAFVPYAGDFTQYPIDNAQGTKLLNKIVYTANTSPSQDDAYIRTIILFEKNTALKADHENEQGCCFPGLHFAYDNNTDSYKPGTASTAKEFHTTTNTMLDETVTIDGVEYHIAVFEDLNGHAVAYGEVLSTLNSVWVDKNIDSDEMKGWGDKMDIIVFSQGIQAEGLTHDQAMAALGEVTPAKIQTWLAGKTDGAVDDAFTEGIRAK